MSEDGTIFSSLPKVGRGTAKRWRGLLGRSHKRPRHTNNLCRSLIRIMHDIGAGQSINHKPLLFEIRRPACIPNDDIVFIVDLTVDLDDQSGSGTVEIGDIGADRMLASEMEAFRLTLQSNPHQHFGVRQVAPEMSGQRVFTLFHTAPTKIPLHPFGVPLPIEDGEENSSSSASSSRLCTP